MRHLILLVFTTTFAAAEQLCQNSVWGQCGGEAWVKEGKATCCSAGSTCVPQVGNKWYSQCIPKTTATGCSKLYSQCGGENYTGSQCCESGSICIPQANNKWYSQCLPVEDSAPTPAPVSGTTPSPTTGSSDECSPRWGQCGGVNWVASGNPTCCAGANTCVPQAGNIWYSQCLPIVESTGSCSPIYGQCGGTNWVAEGKPTCCASGTVCIPQVNNPWYSQCLPGLPTPTVTPTLSPTQIDQPTTQPTIDTTVYCAHAAYIQNGCVCNVAGGYKILPGQHTGESARCLLDPLPDCTNNQMPTYNYCICNEEGGIYKLVKGSTSGDRCLLVVTPSCIHNQHPTTDACICDISAGKFELVANHAGDPNDKVCVSIPRPTCAHNDIPYYKECTCDVGPNWKLLPISDDGSIAYCVSIPLPQCKTQTYPNIENCLCDAPDYKIVNDKCYPSATVLPACSHGQVPGQVECTCTGDLFYLDTQSRACLLIDTNTWPACAHLDVPAATFCKCDGAYETIHDIQGGPDICVLTIRPDCVDGDEIATKYCDCSMDGYQDLRGICRPDSFHLPTCLHGQSPTNDNCECPTSAGAELFHPQNTPPDYMICLSVPRPDCFPGDIPTDKYCTCDEAKGFKVLNGVCRPSDYVPVDCTEGEITYINGCVCDPTRGFKEYFDGKCFSKQCAAGDIPTEVICGCDQVNGYVLNYDNQHNTYVCDLIGICKDGDHPQGGIGPLCKCDAVDGLQLYPDGSCHDPTKTCVDGKKAYTDGCWCNVFDNAFMIDQSAPGEPVCRAVVPPS